jgi:hypothetical protein
MSAKQALVFGASGISGWGVIHELLMSSAETFDRVVGVTARPFEKAGFLLSMKELERVELVQIDLLSSPDDIVNNLLGMSLDKITHVFYMGQCFSSNHTASWNQAKSY